MNTRKLPPFPMNIPCHMGAVCRRIWGFFINPAGGTLSQQARQPGRGLRIEQRVILGSEATLITGHLHPPATPSGQACVPQQPHLAVPPLLFFPGSPMCQQAKGTSAPSVASTAPHYWRGKLFFLSSLSSLICEIGINSPTSRVAVRFK